MTELLEAREEKEKEKEVGGYPEGLFTDKDLVKELLCAICLDVVKDCVETPCGHLFCDECIRDFLQNRQEAERICPMDHLPVSLDKLTAIMSNRRRILGAKVICERQLSLNKQAEEGGSTEIKCPWTGPLRELFKHLTEECCLREVNCPYRTHGCTIGILTPPLLQTHLKDPSAIISHLQFMDYAFSILQKQFLQLETEHKTLQLTLKEQKLGGEEGEEKEKKREDGKKLDEKEGEKGGDKMDEKKEIKKWDLELGEKKGGGEEKNKIYSLLAEKTLFRVLDILRPEEGLWDFVRERDQIDCFSRTCGDDYFVKGVGAIQAPLLVVLAIAFDTDKKALWDSMLNVGRSVCELDRKSAIHHEIYKAVWPTSARDYCLLVHWTKLTDNRYVCLRRSTEHPLVPTDPSRVRADHIGAFVLTAKTPTTTHVTYIEANNLKGNLPLTVIRRVAFEWVYVIKTIRDLAEGMKEDGWKKLDVSKFQ